MVQVSGKTKNRASWGRGFLFGRQRLNLPEPLHEFCVGFGLGSGRVVIAIASTPFCDTGVNSDSAGRVCEDRHGRSPILWKFTLAI
jgi:hypothetical protein